jgi:TetR/AcrR family transcriptional repressor of lmrAB and yxaGH operons
MLDAAGRLFRAGGYHATGLNQVLAEGRAPKGSFYFHFPGGKEQLAAEAMREAAQAIGAQLAEVAERAPDAVSAIEAVIDRLGAELVASDYRCGCPLATVALDASGDSDVIASACADGYRMWRDALVGLLERHGVPSVRSVGLASVALAAIEGGLLLARTARSLTPLHDVRDHLAETFASASTPRPVGSTERSST